MKHDKKSEGFYYPFINRSIKPYIYDLIDLQQQTRRKFCHSEPFALYQYLIEVCKYWRSLEANNFNNLIKPATDVLYWHINYLLSDFFTYRLDLYWLLPGFDGEPIYICGEDVDEFWIESWSNGLLKI